MTKSSIKANRQWSITYKKYGRTFGECSECKSPLVRCKQKEIVCTVCGLIQNNSEKNG